MDLQPQQLIQLLLKFRLPEIYRFINIKSQVSTFNNKFKINNTVTNFKFKNILNHAVDLFSYLKGVFENITSFLAQYGLRFIKLRY
jgi:hypothetical protein